MTLNARRTPLLADLTAIARPPRDTDHVIGTAWWDAATGDYALRMGPGNHTIGAGEACHLVDAIHRHGFRSDQWATDGRRITCTLHDTDWSLAP